MPLQLATFNAITTNVQTVTLGQAQYGVGLRYNLPMRAWYMDLSDGNGVPIMQGARLSPGWSPTFGLVCNTNMGGMFAVNGTDGYSQAALGSQLTLWWWTQAELQAVADAVAAANPPLELFVEIIT